jgi:predicted RNA binding protein YcfA (HicA-like mRNA interferase family)
MPDSLPAITGRQLIRLLQKDGWVLGSQKTHGVGLRKPQPGDRTLVTVIPNKTDSLKPGTLRAILSDDQTRLGRDGLERLIKTYGL